MHEGQEWSNWTRDYMPFGKYKDELFRHIAAKDPKYARWVINNVDFDGIVNCMVSALRARDE